MSSKKAVDLTERRQRELTAPKLATCAPSLSSLRIFVQEHFGTSSTTYRKHVVVGSAPALFVLTCGDERCQDGGHDITHVVMRALGARATQQEGVHACDGRIGSAACGRHIEYKLLAEYQPVN